MPTMVVTRLRLLDPAVLNDFLAGAVAVIEQAKASDGGMGADALAEANDTWWTISAWRDRASIDDFVRTEPHLSVMDHLDEWCDEASFVDWEQDSAELPDWQTCFQHLVADGRSADLAKPSAANARLAFPAPVVPA